MSKDFLKILNAFNNIQPTPKAQSESHTTREERLERSKSPEYNKPKEAPLPEPILKPLPETTLVPIPETIVEDIIEDIIEDIKPEVTFVLTACGRLDLMERTLDSFFKFNTYPIKRFIITEDSMDPVIFLKCKDLNYKKYNNKLEFIFNENKLGQARSIDSAYSKIDTPYIFHCEEDWSFYNPGFIEKSIAILEADKTVLQGWIRPKSDKILNDINSNVYKIGDVEVRDVLPKSFLVKNGIAPGKDLIVRDYMGFSWNPGLKRLSDYKLLRNGYSGFEAEHMIDTFYRSHSTGFKVVSISREDHEGYVQHIGWGRRANDPIDLEEAMLAARKKREEDKARVEVEEKKKAAEAEAIQNEVKLPKISVVMQVYLGDYPGSRVDSVFKFHRAVKSFLDQDYKKSELIIVSDGCNIVHREYYERYASFPNIKYAFVDKTGLMNMYESIGENKYYRGIPRQVGRGVASGDLITYMDSDDYLHPKFIYQIVYNYNMAPDSVVWFVNNTWYDHVNILKQPLTNLLEDYSKSEVINIPLLNAKFVETKVKEGLIVNTPWLLTHKAEVKTRWIDTLGLTSEDVEFGRALREDYKGLGYQFSAPTYIRCHYTGLWDI
jgi:hypothetical protein